MTDNGQIMLLLWQFTSDHSGVQMMQHRK